jgi:P-type conjugative transfer protein TrbJ
MRFLTRKYLIASALGLGTAGSLAMGLTMTSTPAHAQLTVFDPSNYSQNILTAARTLTQINNQIQSLQNQARSLLNQAKNLTTIDFPELQALTQALQQVDRLMGQAQGIRLQVSGLDQQFHQLFPQSFGQALRMNDQVVAARSRLDTAMTAYQHTMTVQA